jgi:hypothetical protein
MPENQIMENEQVQERISYNCIELSSDLLSRIFAIEQKSIIAKFIRSISQPHLTIIGDLKSNLNFLGISVDDPTKISYITYDRVRAAENKYESSRIWEDKNYRYHSSAGKVIRKLLESITVVDGVFENLGYNGISLVTFIEEVKSERPLGTYTLNTLFTEAEYDEFNNAFRVEGFRQGDTGEVIFVKGHWIQELYHEKNYASISGNLGNSCMRYERTNHYLDIYTKNPSVCKLAVLLNSQGKLQGRALVWTVDGVDYYDRIYATSDLIQDRMKAFFLVKGIETCYSGYAGYKEVTISENLDLKDFDKRVILNHQYYPYMDSLKYLSETRDKISTNEFQVDDGVYLILNCTGGGYETSNRGTSECQCCGRETNEDELCHIDVRRDDNYGADCCSNCAIYSAHHDGYITRDEAVYIEGSDWVLREFAISDYEGEFILTDQSIELCDGRYAYQEDPDITEYENNRGYFIIGNIDFDYIEHDCLYYHPDDCIETRDGEIIPTHLTTEHEGEVWLTENLKEHLNLNLL